MNGHKRFAWSLIRHSILIELKIKIHFVPYRLLFSPHHEFGMNVFALFGLIIGVLAVLAGQFLEGGQLSTLANLPALIIVLGGTFGAVMVQTPWPAFLRAMRMTIWIVKPPAIPIEDGMRKIVMWSNTARKEGLLGLEQIVDNEEDVFARKGLSLLVDGGEPDAIRSAMMVDLDMQEQRLMQSARVFEAMGGYSPTLGILGAVIGLIHVMGNLTDPGRLGEGIAVAFVATVYGVGFANLFFLPVGHRLRHVVIAQTQYREMMIEGVIAIAEGENPRVIENKLAGFHLT
jgi:chemotaxis protein MotA